MGAQDIRFSRISKLFVDLEGTTTEAALALRRQHRVALLCGADVAGSYTLQLAVLTAASIAKRCFPGAVVIGMAEGIAEAPLLIWPAMGITFGQAVSEIAGVAVSGELGGRGASQSLLFGDAATVSGALRVTFDGWVAKVGPAHTTARLPEREYFSVAGVLAASLALSEAFLSFAEVSIAATRRTVGISLWRPDLDIDDPAAVGVPVEFLPQSAWLLGLGHLGNAYLWSLATMPYDNPKETEFILNDFDHLEPENVETGLLFGVADGRLKSRVCAEWLERRGFGTRLVERRFDGAFRRQDGEPALALCGFDSNPARRHLATAQFGRVLESGLGGSAKNFDTISFHALPNPRSPVDLWPDLKEEDAEAQHEIQKRMAEENPGYVGLGGDECGRYEFAGKSVAVPFVGVTAASLVVSEAVRLLHGGPAYTDIRLSLGLPDRRHVTANGNYEVADLAGLAYCSAKSR